MSNLLKFFHGGYYPVVLAAVLVAIMLTWQWGRSELARAFYAYGVEGGKKMGWLIALREKVDEIRVSIEENLPLARSLVQGRRRLVETDRAFVFLSSRPIRDLDEYVPVAVRIFLKKYGVLPSHITFFHVAQLTVAEAAKTLAGARFTVTTEVRSGDPVTTVCEAASGYDLLIVGSHGRTGVDRFLLGSVSHGIVHRAGCSVLVVR